MKKAIQRLALIVISTGISILLLEAGVHIFLPVQIYSFEKDLFQSSPDFGYHFTPNTVKRHSQPEYSYLIRTNSYGFRGEEPDLDSTYRILLLGDSYGMGQGVGERKYISSLTMAALRNKGLNLSIFNTAISGYSGINELKVLKKLGPMFRPGLVTLFFAWNDVGPERSLEVRNGYLVLSAGKHWSAPIREWLNTKSYLYCLVKTMWYSYQVKNLPQLQPLQEIPTEILQNSLSLILSMKEACEQIGSEFSVIMVPRWGAQAGSGDFLKSKRYVKQFLQNSSIAVYDWAQALPQNPATPLDFPIDKHWTEEGNRFYSEFYEKILLDHLEIKLL